MFLPISRVLICFTIIFVHVSAETQNGQCVTYGSYEKPSSFLAFSLTKPEFNKVYSGPPKPLEDPDDQIILKKLCPDLSEGENPLTCCDHKQLSQLNVQIGSMLGGVISSCPSCYHNYRQTFCQMICSPRQSEFLEIADTEESPEGLIVSKMNYYISKNFADQVFESCKGVNMPGSSFNVLGLLCIPYGDKCNSQRLLNYAAGRSPFELKFTYVDTDVHKTLNYTYRPMNLKVVPCSEPLSNDAACSCKDCAASCSATSGNRTGSGDGNTQTDEIPSIDFGNNNQTPFQIMNKDGMVVVSIILFCIFILSTGLVVVYYTFWARKGQDEDQRSPLSATLTGCDLGFLEEVEPLRTRHSRLPPCEDDSTGASTPDVAFIRDDEIGLFENLGASFENFLRESFTKWGAGCARRPYLVIFIGLFVSIIFSIGCIRFTVVTDPVELWAAPGSRARVERDYYNEHFEPFYRTEQLIILPTNNSKFVVTDSSKTKEYGPVYRQEFLLEVLKLQNHLSNLTSSMNNKVVGLKDICFRPLYPMKDACTIQSALNYYQNDVEKLMQSDYLKRIDTCTMSPYSFECLSDFGAPIEPHMTLGGYPGKSYHLSEALVITFVVQNSLNDEHRLKAESWEKEFISFLKNYSNPIMTVSYNSERSIQDELDRSSKGDIVTVLVSYVIMFVYISIALGKAKTFSRLFVDSKITLGLSGVLIVVVSALASVGLFSFIGVPATLIIIEVIPFLVLAVGVDNIFILVQALQRDVRHPDESLHSQIGRIVGEVGPSMLLSSVSESCCFFLGALSDMPAVRTFALYAGTALIFDFLLQISCFISLLALDVKRQEDNRLDVCCCIHANEKSKEGDNSEGLLYSLFKNFYAPFLMKFNIRTIVMIIFAGWACSSLAVINKVEIGLDQELAVPEDSFVVDYFTNLRKYLSVGPPVYFVIQDGYNYTSLENQNRICNSATYCDPNSMLAILDLAVEKNDSSYIARGSTYSWLDTYINFMKGSCCKSFKNNGSYCPSYKPDSECDSCSVSTHNNRMDAKSFHKYLPFFLQDIPSALCASGGKAIYDSLVETIPKNNGSDYKLGATSFMAFHTVLKTSKDYYEALRSARLIADHMTDHLQKNSSNPNIKVFPYSVFYVFYEQYLTTWSDVMKSLGISVTTIFVVTFLLLGFDVVSALVIVITIMLILLNLFGLMYWWGITLNAVALVNLVMAVGISVEFCAHITRSFAASVQPTRVLRAKESLINMGSSVLSGITFTKFGGIVVLGFAKSQIFKIYYFKLYLCIVLFGAAHGLIFLPVFLSLIGPALNKKKLKECQNIKQMEMNVNTEAQNDEDEKKSSRNNCTHI